MFSSFLKRINKIFSSKKDKYYQEVYSEDDIKENYSNKYIYHRIKLSLKDKTPKVSHRPICPLDKSSFDQINVSELNKNFGRARAKFCVQLGERKVKVHVYKNVYAGFKTSVTAHFYKKKIFNLRYDFKIEDKNDYIAIADLIGLKYLNGEPIEFESEYLVDENNVVLSFTNEFSLILNYHNNSEIYTYIEHLVDLDEAEKKNKVYDRYKKLYRKL
ncbi:hypothetical protein [Winogradskyella sp.]|uniref:hypothetical protein n=1 Tax=Winogradskyella sp. TaxID=1883156 RepID=UPI003BAC622E